MKDKQAAETVTARNLPDTAVFERRDLAKAPI
jgi:hypothetical protein